MTQDPPPRWHPTHGVKGVRHELNNFLGRVDQRKDVKDLIQDTGEFIHAMGTSRVFQKDLDNLYHNTINKLDERLGKRFGHLDEHGRITEDHYHTRIGDTISIDGKTNVSISEHLPSELARTLVDYMRGMHGANEKVNHAFLERLERDAGDETVQRLIAKKLDQYLGNDMQSQESLSTLMSQLQAGVFKDEKIGDIYDTLDNTIKKAHKELPSRIGSQIVGRIGQVYNALDQDQEDALKAILSAGGFTADNLYKPLEKGVGRVGGEVLGDITQKLAKSEESKELDRIRGYSRVA